MKNLLCRIVNYLKGRKTYLCAVVGAIITFSYIVGWISKETYSVLMTLIGVGVVASVRAAIAGISKK